MKTIQIDIDDFVGYGNSSFNEVKAQMKKAKGHKVRAVVNGYGGLVTDGVGIYNLLRGHDGDTEVHIASWAFSADTIIAMGAENTTMAENGFFMVHNPLGGAYGEAEDMEATAAILRMMEKQLIDIYHRKTKLGKRKIKELMDAESWLSAKEALDLGFVDALTEGAKITNHFDTARFSNITPPPFPTTQTKNTISDMKTSLFQAIKNFFNTEHDANEEAIEAEVKKHGTLEDFTNNLRTQIEGEFQQAHDAELEALNTAHTEALTEVQEELTQTKNALNAANEEIATLKAKPAAPRTPAASAPPAGGNDPKKKFAGTITEKVAQQMAGQGSKLPFE